MEFRLLATAILLAACSARSVKKIPQGQEVVFPDSEGIFPKKPDGICLKGLKKHAPTIYYLQSS